MFCVTKRVDGAGIVTAWTFVAPRLLHSVLHIVNNDVRVRCVAFALSNLGVGALWILLFAKA